MKSTRPYTFKCIREFFVRHYMLISICGVLLVVFCGIIFSYHWLQRTFPSFVQNQLSPYVGGTVHYSDLKLLFPNSIQITDLVLKTPYSDTIISVKKATTTVSLKNLVLKKINLTLLSLYGANVCFDQDARINLGNVFRNNSPPSKNRGGKPWIFYINKFTLDSSAFQYIKNSTPFAIDCRTISASGSISKTMLIQAKLFCSEFQIRTSDQTLFGDSVALNMASSVNDLTIGNLKFTSPGLRAYACSLYIPYSSLPWHIAINSTVNDTAFSLFSKKQVPIDRCSVAYVSIRLNGTLVKPLITATCDAYKTEISSVPISKTHLEASHDSSGHVQARVILNDNGISSQANISLFVQHLMQRPVLDSFALQTRIKADCEQALILKKIPLFNHITGGTVLVNLQSAGVSLSQLPKTITGSMVLSHISTTHGYTLDTAFIHTHVNNGTYTLQTRIPHTASIMSYGTIEDTTFSGTIRATIPKTQTISQLFFNEVVAGSLNAYATFNGSAKTSKGRLFLNGSNLQWQNLMIDTSFAQVCFDTKLGLRGVTIEESSLSVHGPLNKALERLLHTEAGGYMKGTLNAKGSVLKPQIHAFGIIDHPYAGVPLADTLQIAIMSDDTILQISKFSLRKDSTLIEGTASLNTTTNAIKAEMALLSTTSSQKIGTVKATAFFKAATFKNVLITGKTVPLSIISSFYPTPNHLNGHLSFDALGEGTIAHPHMKAQLHLTDFAPHDFSIDPDLRIHANLNDHKLFALCSLSIHSQIEPVLATLYGRFTERWQLDSISKDKSAEMRILGRNVNLQPFSNTFFDSMALGGYINTDFSLIYQHGVWRPQGNFNLTSGSISIPNKLLNVHGVTIHLNPTNKSLTSYPEAQFDLSVSAQELMYHNTLFHTFSVQGKIKADTFTIDSSSVFLQKGKLSFRGTIPLASPKMILNNQNSSFVGTIDSFPIVALNPFIASGKFLTGTVDGTISLHDKNSELCPHLDMKGRNIVFSIPSLQPAIGPLELSLDLNRDTLLMHSLSGTWGKGTISGDAQLFLNNYSLQKAHISLQGCRISVRNVEDEFTIDSLLSTINFEQKQWSVNGYITLDESAIARDIFLNQLTVPSVTTPKNLSGENDVNLSIEIHIPKPFSADVNIGQFFTGFNTQLKTRSTGHVQIHGSISQPQYSGIITITDGTITFLDNLFTINQGYARLTSSTQINPSISATATSVVKQTQGISLKDSLVVTLTVTGEMNNPEIHLSSFPIAYSEPDIISLLTFGAPSFTETSNVRLLTERASSLLSNTLSTYASKKAQQFLGLNSVQIHGDFFNKDNSLANTSITINKKIGSNLSLTYRKTGRSYTNQQGIISWKILPFLYLEGESDIAGNAGVDIKFKAQK